MPRRSSRPFGLPARAAAVVASSLLAGLLAAGPAAADPAPAAHLGWLQSTGFTVADLDGGNAEQVVTPELLATLDGEGLFSHDLRDADLSPGGHTVAVIEARTEITEDAAGHPAEDRVILVGLDDDSLRLVASVTEGGDPWEQLSGVSWTRAGDQVLVQKFAGDTASVLTVDPADASFTEEAGYLPSAPATQSPDGASTVGWLNDSRHLCVFRNDDNSNAACTPSATGEAGDSPFLNAFAFSPDGTEVASVQGAYDESDDNAPLGGAVEQVVVTPAVGGAGRVLLTATHLTAPDWAISSVIWSRDGAWLYATVRDNGNGEWAGPEKLVRVPRNGGIAQVIVEPADADDYLHAVRRVSVSGPAPALDAAAPGAPATPVISLDANPSSPGQIDVHTSTPADADLAGVTVRMAEGSTPPASITDGDPVVVGLFGGDGSVYDLALGSTYSFAVFATDWAGNTSAAATASVTLDKSVSLWLEGTPAAVAPNAAVMLTATSTDPETGAPLAGRTVTLESLEGAQEIPRGTAVTNASGVARFTVRRGTHTQYFVSQAAGNGYTAATSELYQLRIRGTVAITVPGKVQRGRKLTVTTTVNPAGSNQLVTLQRRSGARWITVTKGRTSGSKATFSLLSKTAATWDLRAVVASSARWYGGTSRTARVRIA